MSRARLAVIGCGQIAQQVHLPALRSLHSADQVAVADSETVALAAAGRIIPAARKYSDYRSLLDKEQPDAVLVCLPTHLHAEAGIEVLAHGAHLYLEKPIATALEPAQKLLRIWRDSDRVGMIGFNYRFHPFVAETREIVQSGQLGELTGARSLFTGRFEDPPEWKSRPDLGGSALLELGSHQIDLLTYALGGRVQSVFARSTEVSPQSDHWALQIQLDSGLTAQVICSSDGPALDQLEIFGTKQRLFVDRYRGYRPLVSSRGFESRGRRTAHRLRSFLSSPLLLQRLRRPKYEPSYSLAISRFIELITEPPSRQVDDWPDLESGYECLRVLLAAKRSAAQGRVVLLDEIGQEVDA